MVKITITASETVTYTKTVEIPDDDAYFAEYERLADGKHNMECDAMAKRIAQRHIDVVLDQHDSLFGEFDEVDITRHE